MIRWMFIAITHHVYIYTVYIGFKLSMFPNVEIVILSNIVLRIMFVTWRFVYNNYRAFYGSRFVNYSIMRPPSPLPPPPSPL